MVRLGVLFFALTCWVAGSAAAPAAEGVVGDCSLGLAYPYHLRTPKSGFKWIDGYEQPGPCRNVGSGRWTTAPAGNFNVMVDADGSIAEGHLRNVKVGLAPKRGGKAPRGFCFEASTLGWRTLLDPERLPITWTADLDGDGAAELVLWSSFPVKNTESTTEYGLVAWVYRLGATGKFDIDWRLTRKIAADLAEDYRASSPDEPGEGQSLDEARAEASRKLQALADDQCWVHRISELP